MEDQKLSQAAMTHKVCAAECLNRWLSYTFLAADAIVSEDAEYGGS